MHSLAQIKTALVIEDDFLIAQEASDILLDLGVGRVLFVPDRLAFVGVLTEQIEFAVVDLMLNGELCYDVVAELQRRGIPFIYFTGYNREDHQRLPVAPWVSKPGTSMEIAEAAVQAINASQTAASETPEPLTDLNPQPQAGADKAMQGS